MTNIIIRKPKFMRSDSVAALYLMIAESMAESLTRPGLSVDEQYDVLKTIGECTNKAAKAAGFFRTKDFIKWNNIHKNK